MAHKFVLKFFENGTFSALGRLFGTFSAVGRLVTWDI